MSRTLSLGILEQVRIASPCPVRWDEMTGDDKARHCAQCDLSVHNLSAMTENEVEDLFARHQGRLCAGFFRRADGTILTKDCPVGLRLARERLVKVVSRVAAAIGVVVSGGLLVGARGEGEARLGGLEPFATLRDWFSLAPVRRQTLTWTAGSICPMPPRQAKPLGGGGTGSLGDGSVQTDESPDQDLAVLPPDIRPPVLERR